MWYRILWLLVFWPIVADAEQHALTLEQAIEQAVREAPQVAASAALLEGSQEFAPGAGRLPAPELVIGVDNLPIDGPDQFSLTRDFMTMRKIGVMQSFPSGKKRRLQSESAEREVGIAHGEWRKSRFDAGEAAAEAWIAAAVAEQSLARLQSLKLDTELGAAAARTALSSGRATAAQALRTESLLLAVEERILSFTQESESQRAELARWIGTEADGPLAAIPTDRALDHSMEALIAGVPEHAPLAPTVARLDAARTEVELARAEKRSDWSAELTYAERGPDFSDMVSLEFRVALPFFAKHRLDPLIAEKVAAVHAREAERDSEVRMHTAEVRAAVAQWRLGRQRVDQYVKEILPLARDRSRATLAAYSSGRGDLGSAIEALTDEINGQLEEVELEGSVAHAWVFLHLLHDSGTTP